MGRKAILVVAAAAFFSAGAAFGVDFSDPRSRAKAVSAAAAAPPVASARAELPELSGGVDAGGRTLSGACAANTVEVCYDQRSGRIVFKGSRHLMPAIEGLTAEHISVRRSRIQLQYSFR